MSVSHGCGVDSGNPGRDGVSADDRVRYTPRVQSGRGARQATANPFHPHLSVAVNFFHVIEKDIWAGLSFVLLLLLLHPRMRGVCAAILPRASVMLGRFDTGGSISRLRDRCERLADELRAILEAAIDERRVTLSQVLDPRYEEARGPLIARFAKALTGMD